VASAASCRASGAWPRTAATGGIGGLVDGLGGLLGRDEGEGEGGDEPDQVVAEVTEQVADLRELEPTGEVEVAFLDDTEITAELETLLERDLDLEDLAARTEALVALRAVPAGTDLAALQRELLTGQVAGFYAPEEERLVVRVPDGAIRPLDRITLAHELVHAIVDQRVGLPDLADGIDADAALARLAVIEGDATLLMNRWSLEHLSFADQLGLAGAGDLVAQQEQLEAVPHHLARELVFPYTAGLDLICDRWLEGGWSAVDEAYDDPPTTTAEVLFGARAGAAPPPPLAPPPGGHERLTDTFGAAPLLWLFEAPGGDTEVALDDPTGRAAAWAGGQVQLWDVAGEPVVGLALSEHDGAGLDLCASVTDWYAAAAPGAERDEDDGSDHLRRPGVGRGGALRRGGRPARDRGRRRGGGGRGRRTVSDGDAPLERRLRARPSRAPSPASRRWNATSTSCSRRPRTALTTSTTRRGRRSGSNGRR
jgi:hypothetical protein